ncbi:MAG: hypothetical protein ACK4YQ_04120 [Phenylobacterium sp.]|uniref:hypothetical protein n=1 Tax=Phenylobacterium sp. TaxID=1871053 RepID=UPI00391A8EA1
MCDTFAALPRTTARGALLFAKNSDRERNEAQALELHGPRRGGESVRLTYLTIPDVAVTRTVLISRPFWMWGAEMGANDAGVVIGNEALHARTPAQRRPALTGMDLVRLGLERAGSAAEALEVIIELLERHGQGGDCGHLSRFYYHNGFIIADHAEAYVLETMDRWWAVERVAGVRALSNAYSISGEGDRLSPALEAHAEARGWRGQDGRLDLASHLIDEARDAVGFGRGRCARGGELLARGAGRLTPAAMMGILRDHGEVDEEWSPATTARRTICMHAAEGARRSQTVASMVSEIRRDAPAIHWVTASAAPCTAVFKPVILEAGAAPPVGRPPSDRYDGASLWWRHERLHRRVLKDYRDSLDYAAERDALEASFVERIDAALSRDAGPQALASLVENCWREAAEAEARWEAALPEPRRGTNPPAYSASWSRLNHVARFPRV